MRDKGFGALSATHPAAVEALYAAMAHCQGLHPDPMDEDGDDDAIFAAASGDDAEEGEEGDDAMDDGDNDGDADDLTPQGRAVMERLDAMLAASGAYTEAGAADAEGDEFADADE